MKTNYEIRYAAHPEDAKSYDTQRIRRDFLIEKVFAADEVNMVYSMYDRMVVGGAMPVNEELKLEAIDPLKAPFFTTRREIGVFNVGGAGCIKVGDAVFELDYKEALYIGRGDRDVVVLANPEAAHAFDGPKKRMLEDLYMKYWRMLPIAKGYPKDAPLNHGLTPPTVPQFRVMLEHEAKVNGYTA